MKLKGISPLVATVLLVSITIVVAAIVASWANFFVKGKTDNIQKQSDADEKCQFANFRIIDGLTSWDSTNRQVSVSIDNIGSVELSNFTFIVSYPTAPAELANSSQHVSVSPGGFATIKTSTLTGTEKPDEVIVRPQCLDVTSRVQVP